MLTRDEAGRVAAFISGLNFDIEEGYSNAYVKYSAEAVLWLAEKLREVNDECSRVHAELQKANEELARVYEVYGP